MSLFCVTTGGCDTMDLGCFVEASQLVLVVDRFSHLEYLFQGGSTTFELQGQLPLVLS